MRDAILVLNAGSSSIKFSLFAQAGDDLELDACAARPRACRPRRASSPRVPAATRCRRTHWAEGTPLGHDAALEHIVAFLREHSQGAGA